MYNDLIVRPELLVKNPLRIANNYQAIVVNFHQEFTARVHSNFFQGQTDGGLFYWPNLSAETRCPINSHKKRCLSKFNTFYHKIISLLIKSFTLKHQDG
jgi:hypothetical protein